MTPRNLLLILLMAGLSPLNRPDAHAAEGASPDLARWIEGRRELKTWEAEFTQTRRLKSLAEPLVATGRVWFAAPQQFRWELGHPPETVAVRQEAELWIYYPGLKRAERYPLSESEGGPWRSALTLLETGFPRDLKELTRQFRIRSESSARGTHEVVLEPRSPSARRMIPRIRIGFSPADQELQFTELEFSDGSTLRNDFHRPVRNPVIPPERFTLDLPPGVTVAEPLKR